MADPQTADDIPWPGTGITSEQRRANTEWIRAKVRRADSEGVGTVYLPDGEYDLDLGG